MNTQSSPVTGSVRLLLRLEGLVLFALGVLLWARAGEGWGRFAALFLIPDLSFAGYLLGPRVGAVTYNAMHSQVGPMALGALALVGLLPAACLPLSFLWLAHVGFDRALGYGLKYASAFGHTHLGLIGKAAQSSAATAH